MKKQLLIAAVAATMGTAAMADLSITGNGKFEYFNSQTGSAASTNTTNTEVNLGIVGKSGDTSVVLNMEFNTHGATSITDTDTVASAVNTTTGVITSSTSANGANDTLNIEDMYMTTKIGDVSVKAGNYATGTSSILGEIDNGGRATNKVTLTTEVAGATVYVGNTGAVAGASTTAIDNNMFAGVKMNVAGVTVQAKKLDEESEAYGISGDLNGVSYRLEQKSDTAANGDVTFGQVSGSTNGIDLSYAWIDADVAGKVGEDDSAIFAVEMATSGTANSTATGNKQISAKTSIAGNTVTIKAGSVEAGITGGDLDYFQVGAVRSLASGATATVLYTDKSATTTTDTETLEVELAVKF